MLVDVIGWDARKPARVRGTFTFVALTETTIIVRDESGETFTVTIVETETRVAGFYAFRE